MFSFVPGASLVRMPSARSSTQSGLESCCMTWAAVAERFFLTLFFLLTAALGIAWFTQKPVVIPTLRFAVEAPPGTRFPGPRDSAAISPDGTLLVFEATRAGGRSTLWLRPLDSLDARELPGTEDSSGPFWSADGKSVGFFADGKLKRVDMAGGNPQVLCEAEGAQGGTWNQDGAILFGAKGAIEEGRRYGRSSGTGSPRPTVRARRRCTGIRNSSMTGVRLCTLSRVRGPTSRSIYAASLDQPGPGARILATASEAQAMRGRLGGSRVSSCGCAAKQRDQHNASTRPFYGCKASKRKWWQTPRRSGSPPSGTLVYRSGNGMRNRALSWCRTGWLL